MAQVYVAKPQKVHADQFRVATTPWPVEVCTEATPFGVCSETPLFEDWRPHVHGDGTVYVLLDTDWITHPVAFPERVNVLSDAQFEELYGQQPGADITGG
jgi:hypothetical protein